MSMLLSIVSCCAGSSDADDDADDDDAENGADNVTSCSHGDAVVAEPCSDERVIDSCQSVTVSTADTTASRQVHKPTVLPTCLFLVAAARVFLSSIKLVHGQVTIIFVVSVGLSVCLFVCLFVQSFSQPSLIRFRSN